jgi:hypothetical protein
MQVHLLRRARLAHGLASKAQPGGGVAAPEEIDADWKTLLALTTSPEVRRDEQRRISAAWPAAAALARSLCARRQIKRKIGHLKADLLALQEQQLESLNPKARGAPLRPPARAGCACERARPAMR